jgi:hypothetical protein
LRRAGWCPINLRTLILGPVRCASGLVVALLIGTHLPTIQAAAISRAWCFTGIKAKFSSQRCLNLPTFRPRSRGQPTRKPGRLPLQSPRIYRRGHTNAQLPNRRARPTNGAVERRLQIQRRRCRLTRHRLQKHLRKFKFTKKTKPQSQKNGRGTF